MSINTTNGRNLRLTPHSILILKGIEKRYNNHKALICYQNRTIWNAKKLGYEKIDVNISGNLYGKKNRNHVIVKPFGFGAPNVAMLIEELSAMGISTFIEFGTIGALQNDLKFGDCILCDRALIGEGTSQYYAREIGTFSYPDIEFISTIDSAIEGINGTVWTTDAPYRETLEEIHHYANLGYLGVNMETSAFYSVCTTLGLRAASICLVSDLLQSDDIIYCPKETERSLDAYFKMIIEWIESK